MRKADHPKKTVSELASREDARFDRKIERDAKSGKLDRLAAQALRDFNQGRAREI